MAAGVAGSFQPFVVLSTDLSVHVASPNLPVPSSACSAAPRAVVGAGPRVATTPAVPLRVLGGVKSAMHDGQWFDRIHVIPRRVDLGSVNNDRTVVVEVWNAWRRGHVLTSAPITGPAGVTVAAGTLPRIYAPFHSELQTVSIAAAGSAALDNVVTWVFGALVSPGADLTLTGLRVMLFTARPDGSVGFEETYGYETDVLTAWDGTEQRVLLRELPTRTLRFAALLTDSLEVADVMGRLFANGVLPFSVPLWPDATRPAWRVNPGDAQIVVTTTGRGFVAGGTALLWKDQWTFEAVVINQVFSDHLTLVGTVAGSWPAEGSVIVPLISARLLSAPSVERISGGVASVDLEFSWEAA